MDTGNPHGFTIEAPAHAISTMAVDLLADRAAERRRTLAGQFGFAERSAGRKPVPSPGIIYGVEDKPPPVLTLLAGMQWVGLINVYLVFLLVLLRQGDAPPSTVAAMVGLSMLALGLGALLQALPRGPVGSGYLAPAVLTANYLGPSILALKLGGLPLVFGMTIFAGLCESALSCFVGRLRRLFPTELQGLVVFLIGVVVGSLGFRLTFAIGAAAPAGPAHLAVAALTFATTITLTLWGRGAARMLALLIAMTLGYAAAVATGLLTWSDLTAFGAVPLFAVPRFDHLVFAFSPGLIVPFAIAALASTAKSMGLLSQCQKLNDAQWREPDLASLRRGVLADGLATVFSGLLGTIGVNTTPSSIAVPAATGLASRRVAYAIAAILLVMAFLPMIGVVLALMPKPVIGGVTLFLSCLIMINGLQTIASCRLDQRQTVVVGLGIIAGLAAEKYPHLAAGMPLWVQAVTGSALVFGTSVAMLANILLPPARAGG
ncbi:MAG TPA: solute carrier family 23 protein [Stellaceae bacterium]|nr:solute carrier family 23 protein [Stellaceae bacterium]